MCVCRGWKSEGLVLDVLNLAAVLRKYTGARRDYLGTLKIIYERDDGGLDQASCSRSNVNWKYILQVELP